MLRRIIQLGFALWLLVFSLQQGYSSNEGKIEQERKNLEQKISEILILSYCHADFAYGHTRDWHEKRYNLVMNDVLDLLGAEPSFKYMFDTYWDFLHPFLVKSPERIGELKKYVIENRVGIAGGQISNSKPDTIGGELYIRNLILGKRKFKELFPEKEIVAASSFDNCYGYTQMPQILKLSGFAYWWFSRALDPFGGGLKYEDLWQKKGIPREFIWKGLDGTEVITSRIFYAGLMETFCPINDIQDWDRKFQFFYETFLDNPKDPNHPDALNQSKAGVLAIPQGSDDTLPLRRRVRGLKYDTDHVAIDPGETRLGIMKFVKECNKKEEIPLRFATPEDYFNGIEKEKDKLPLVGEEIKEMADRGDPGLSLMGNKDLQLLWGKVEKTILLLEKAEAFLYLVDKNENVGRKEIEKLWFDLSSTTGHGKWCLFTDDFNNELAKIKGISEKAEAYLNNTLEKIAEKISFDKTKGVPVVLFNFSNWERKGNVDVTAEFTKAGVRNLVITDGKKTLPCEIEILQQHKDNSIKQARISFVSFTIPPLGYKIHYLKPIGNEKPQDKVFPLKEPFIFENRYYKAKISPEGCLLSLKEKENNTELINNPENRDVFFDVMVDKKVNISMIMEKDTQQESFHPHYKESFVQPGPVKTEVVAEGVFNIKGHVDTLIKRITFYQDLPWIALDFEITTEGGYGGGFKIAFPVSLVPEETKISANIPFGIEDKGNIDSFWCREWVDLSNSKGGITVINESGRGKYSVVKENRSITLRHLLLPTVDTSSHPRYRERSPDWTGKGTHQFRMSLYPHSGGWKEAKSWQVAENLSYPLISLKKSGNVTSLPEEHSFLEVKPGNVVLSSLNVENGGLNLRFYETTGNASDFSICLSNKTALVQKTDFLARSISDSSIKISHLGKDGDVIEGQIRPWEIVNFKMNLK